MKLKPLKLSKEAWILIFLSINDFEPVKDLSRLHYIFFLYDLLGFKYRAGFFGPYSEELERCLLKLQQMGYIKVHVYKRQRTYLLTEKGKEVALKLINKIKDKYVILNDVVIMKGDEVIKDLSRLKRKYLNSTLLYLMYICMNRFKDNWPVNMSYTPSAGEMIFVNEMLSEFDYRVRYRGLL